MALVRAAAPPPDVTPVESIETLLQQLAGGDALQRRQAARALASHPDAIFDLADRLAVEPEASVRNALFQSLHDIGGTMAAGLMAPLFMSPDAALRGEAVDGLKRLASAAVPALDALLSDADPDVRLLAIEVTRAWPRALAEPRLRRILESETHVNVCGAAIDVAAEVGGKDLITPLVALRARFEDEPFLVFAVDIALSRIQSCDESVREPDA